MIGAALVLGFGAAQRSSADDGGYFSYRLAKGQRFSHLVASTDSIRGEGFAELVTRNSGSIVYTVLDPDPRQPVLDVSFRFDGGIEGDVKKRVRDSGRTLCEVSGYGDETGDTHGDGGEGGGCVTITDATSYLFLNSLLWGTPPAQLHMGTSWTVDIPQAWTLGPAGTQTVRVISLDPATRSITLLREGRGTGFSTKQGPDVTLMYAGTAVTARIVPGLSHWTGYATIREGVVVHDELMITRPVTLMTKDHGEIRAEERQYALLSETPPG